ncbi:Fe-Mn family superoxide dismutase [Cohnella silvisoli]|uniref:superoxide dismutase n=1 Tax=Cohnella silvisoli TaxID=2873699 RepID=A0ABV1KR85_9BACL|nr:Fe-Mn family superoxide dismutase [Cohnella silvisoli]MCD9024540.1 superoxide dismutase [Cohnella silvisoli]
MRAENGNVMQLRLLEEIAYWKIQELEHTVVVRSLVPELETPYVQWLQQWENVFAKTQEFAQRARGLALSAPDRSLPAEWAAALPKLVEDSLSQSKEFSRQLQLLPEHSAAIGQTRDSSIALDYIRRQPEYSNSVIEQLERSGAISQVRSQDGEDDSPEGYGGPEPADTAARPALDKVLEGKTERPEGTWSDPIPMGDIGQQDVNASTVNPVPIGGHKLPPLPYSYKALEPYIDEKTMRIHHDKHHQSYVDGLNTAEKKLEEARRTGDFDLVKHWERELAFNGAGHYLHTLFWDAMSPRGGGKPSGAMLEGINRSFGSYDAFKKQFTEAANKVEGGGWAILVWSPRSHRLEILTAEKHQNLSQWDVVPLLPLDVWEHAYYLKHQNERAAYIRDWWNVVNWPYVTERYAKARTLEWVPY